MGCDGLCFRLALADAPLHMGYPKFRMIELLFIVGDNGFMPCLSGRFQHGVVQGLKCILGQAGNIYNQMTREQLHFGIPTKCQDFSV